MLSKEEGQKIVEQVLGTSHADDVLVTLVESNLTHLRYARNTPSTSGQQSDYTLTVQSTFGKKSASASVNQLDAATISEVVERSEQLARLAPDNPEQMPGLGPQSYPSVSAFDESLLTSGASDIVRGTALCIDQARALGLTAAGYSEASATASWIGNRQGLAGYHRNTDVAFSQTVRTSDAGGSGWAAGVGNGVSAIDYAGCSKLSIQKAQASTSPRPLAPGKYVTILEPSCVASLMQILSLSMNVRSAEEGRSYFSEPGGKTKLGKKLFPESVSIHSDPSSPLAPGTPWGEEALPQAPRTWIDRGSLSSLFCERFWAQKGEREAVPPPSNLLMSGGKGSLDELIADTRRGVLITSLFYIRFVDPRTLLLTGLTRDGVFWIEDGKLSHPVTNFRWNESPVRVLEKVEAMTAAVRAPSREGMETTSVVPALRVKEFELSSVSDAV
ncbi:MAG TPA: metallopeptidase TldD-related protein [Polyangiaceae bacterium]|nr:metallopeptidase TldD-related protein [Polyangiaceae bacterium]